MKPQRRIWTHAAAAALLIVALSGCSGVPAQTGTAASTASAKQASPQLPLRKGMKPDEIRRLLGEPLRKRPVSVASGQAEQWVYERGRKTEVRKIAAETQEVPYFDPFTGQMRMILEPLYTDEAVTIIEELHLFWLNGELAGWKTEYRTDRSYTR